MKTIIGKIEQVNASTIVISCGESYVEVDISNLKHNGIISVGMWTMMSVEIIGENVVGIKAMFIEEK